MDFNRGSDWRPVIDDGGRTHSQSDTTMRDRMAEHISSFFITIGILWQLMDAISIANKWIPIRHIKIIHGWIGAQALGVYLKVAGGCRKGARTRWDRVNGLGLAKITERQALQRKVNFDITLARVRAKWAGVDCRRLFFLGLSQFCRLFSCFGLACLVGLALARRNLNHGNIFRGLR